MVPGLVFDWIRGTRCVQSTGQEPWGGVRSSIFRFCLPQGPKFTVKTQARELAPPKEMHLKEKDRRALSSQGVRSKSRCIHISLYYSKCFWYTFAFLTLNHSRHLFRIKKSESHSNTMFPKIPCGEVGGDSRNINRPIKDAGAPGRWEQCSPLGRLDWRQKCLPFIRANFWQRKAVIFSKVLILWCGFN